jgi:hypothetical protein
MAALAPLLAIAFAFLVASAHAADPFAFFDWDVTYMTASPLGVPQKVRPASLSLSLSLTVGLPPIFHSISLFCLTCCY